MHEVYEKIAPHFSGTRHSPWPKIAEFLREQPVGSLVADVGCGNGKYLGINENIFKTGSDRSVNLAAICRERGFPVIVCDILSLPYRYRELTRNNLIPKSFKHTRFRFTISIHFRTGKR